MKNIALSATLLFIAFLFACTAPEPENTPVHDPMDYEKVLGAPEAVVETEDFPENTISGPLAYAPDVPKLNTGDVVHVRIDVQHKLIEIKEGVKFWAWPFGDDVPGPVLRVKVGQRVIFKMANRSMETIEFSPPMPHSIDFHAALVSPSDKYRSVPPGQTITFEWVANYPGVFMYHCGTTSILQHMVYGMVGMTIVEPKDGFPGEVDREIALIQNEYYLKEKEDGTYMVDFDAARKKQPMFVAFNGKPAQYVQNPIKVKAGERIRLYLLNVGPNDQSSFHIVGTLFDKVWWDGNPVNEMRGMQTVLLGASSGAIVEFTLPEPGTYPFVDHEFADVEAGAVGLFIAE
ncbi:MAG: nitrite reductase [Bacteroidetes bacterium]|nr:MAG: nitrite reductase [Bacteroidota bacterium]